MVFHDKALKEIVPLFDFISTCHKGVTIENILNLAWVNMQIYGEIDQIKPFGIVTDFSFSLINSILSIFNKTNINEYLDICYEYLVENDMEALNKIKVRSFLCATHFLKMIIDKTRVKNADKSIVKTYNLLFTVLQNCVTFYEFETVFTHICWILECPFKNNAKFQESFDYIDTILRERSTKIDLSEIIDEEISDYQEQSEDSFQNSEPEDVERTQIDEERSKRKKLPISQKIDLSNEKTIREKSKFFQYFNNIQNKIETEIVSCLDFDNMDTDLNMYYNQEVLNLISSYNYIMPLWSGVMLNDLALNKTSLITRVTNNSVENYFKIKKHSTLNHQKKKLPSEITTPFLLKVRSLALKYDLKGTDFINQVIPCQLNEDRWVDKKEKKKRPKKSFYYGKSKLNQQSAKKLVEKAKRRMSSRSVRMNSLSSCNVKRAKIDSPIDFDDISSDEENDDVFDNIKTQKSTKSTRLMKKLEPYLNIKSMRDLVNHIPMNSCVFKPKRGQSIRIFNSCTIDYFLFSLWVSTKIDTNYKTFLDARKCKDELYVYIIEIINLIDQNNWPKAKFIWLTNCLKLKEANEFNCLGSTYEFFISTMLALQNYKEIKTCSCDSQKEINYNSEWPLKTFEINSIVDKMINNGKIACDECKLEYKLSILFKLEPIWLIVDIQDKDNSIDIRRIPIYLNFDNKNSYILLCMYSYFASTESISHFKGVFYLNEKYHWVDDLITNRIVELKEKEFTQQINIIIYLKKI
jgi:hypothetical protein